LSSNKGVTSALKNYTDELTDILNSLYERKDKDIVIEKLKHSIEKDF
jgi:hypothetical protein